MCLIIASSTGKRIPDEILEDAARTNQHGGGVAWFENGKIKYRKGLDLAHIIEILDGPAKGKSHVVHFRIATIGGVSDELTHPFSIDARASVDLEGEADAVLFQNGTFSSWKEYLLQAAASSKTVVPEPPWSDSRAVAFLCHVYGKHVLSLLDNTSRFLVFDGKDLPDRRMLLWGSWHTHDEFKFSNTGNIAFRPVSHSSGGSSTNFRGAEGDDAAESDGLTEAPNTSTQSTTGRDSSPPNSETGTTSSVSTRAARKFKPKPGYDYWRVFDAKGVYVKADNEETSNVVATV